MYRLTYPRVSFSRPHRASLLSALILLALLLMPAQAAYAGTITVTTTADSGAGSLRQAIADAVSGDTITFAAGIAGGTITLGGTVIVIDKNLTITGPSAGMIIDGNNASGVLSVENGSTVEISNLTITRGNVTGGGGGILNNGTLTLNNCTISSNNATAYGGGINNNAAILTINNSTITGNSADFGGGAIADSGSTITINFSTITNNSTPAAAAGGGLDLFSAGTRTIKNSILAGNTNGSGASNVVTDAGATLTSQGYNLESGTDAGFTQPTDLQNSDPLLKALDDNGGPTKTHALENGSPALEKIPSSTNGCGTDFTTDQRGLARPGSKNATNKCEIGAWEAQSADPTAISLAGFSAATSSTGGWGGLLAAGLTLLAGLAVWQRKGGVSAGGMAATAQPASRLPLPARQDAPASGRRPYTPPAILHELALETRAGSVLGVDPLNGLFGTDNE